MKEYCSSHNNMPYYSCSAKTTDNVKDAFKKVVELALNRVNIKEFPISEKKIYKNNEKGR